MKKLCTINSITWNTCPLYVDGVEVPGATQEYCTIKAVDSGLSAADSILAELSGETHTVNIMFGSLPHLIEASKTRLIPRTEISLYIERVTVPPFGRVWTSGARTGQDVCDRSGKPIVFNSIKVVRIADVDMVREALRERTRGIAHGSMFEWDEDATIAAEAAAAADPLASVPANAPAPAVGAPAPQRRH